MGEKHTERERRDATLKDGGEELLSGSEAGTIGNRFDVFECTHAYARGSMW